jgi:hypothetical protein
MNYLPLDFLRQRWRTSLKPIIDAEPVNHSRESIDGRAIMISISADSLAGASIVRRNGTDCLALRRM